MELIFIIQEVKLETLRELIVNSGGYLMGGMVWFTDHWSGVAAFVLFATQLFINIRTIRRK